MADNVNQQKTAADYVGSTLLARTTVNVYSSPGGTLLRTIKKGGHVGTIYSWVLRDGFVWWELTGGGFVKHDPAAFDASTAEATSYQELQKAEKAAQEQRLKDADPFSGITDPLKNIGTGLSDTLSGLGKALSGIGNNLSTILIAVAIIIVIVVVFQAYKTAKQ